MSVLEKIRGERWRLGSRQWSADRAYLHAVARRLARSKLLWSAALSLLLYTLGGFLLAPYLVERYLPRFAEQKLDQRATLGAVRINPFLFKLEAAGFQLQGGGERPLLAFKRLYVDFELSSVFHRAWTFADVQVEGLDLGLEIDRDGRLNLAELLERLRDPNEPEGPVPRMIFERVAVKDGSIGLLDLSRDRASAKFIPVNLQLAGVSTLRDSTGQYTLSATLPGGGSLAWKGNVSLEPLASNGDFTVRGMKLSAAWRFLRDELNIAEPQGELAFAGSYDAAYRQGKSALSVDGFRAELSGLSLALPEGASPLVALKTIRIGGTRFSLDRRELVVRQLDLFGGVVNASISNDGTLDWQRIGSTANPAPEREEQPVSGAPAAQAWRVRLEKVGIEKVALSYADGSKTPDLAVRAGELKGGFKLDMTAGAGPARIVAEEVELAVSGAALTAPASEAPVATLESFALAGGRIDTRAREVLAKSIALTGGGLKIDRGPDGPSGLLRVLMPVTREPAPVARATRKKPAQENAWQYRVDSVELQRFAVRLADRVSKPALDYDIDVVSASLTQIDSAAKSPIAFAAELRTGGGGSVKGSGNLQQDFRQARAKVEVADIGLRALRPLVSRYTVLDLKSANLAATAQITYRAEARPSLTARGAASVHNLLLNESDSGERLLAWKTLFADNIALSLSPDSLVVKEVRVLEPGMKMVIAQDRTINLTKVMRKDASAARSPGGKAPAPPAPATPAETSDTDPFPFEIGRIRLEGGTLDFADFSLVLPFATRVHALGGSIVGISSDPKSRAQLKLAGEIDTYGEARAEGVLIPRSPTKFLDIVAQFDNVQIPPLSPYSATFAGRKIAAGKLWLTLHYKIVNEQLAGQNTIILEDFRLGERVASPTAMDLPLDLAIALLRGSDGKIRLAVPVTGDVGNPKFDYGTVIRGAIANVLTSLVTAPFRMLAGLLGGGKSEEIRKVEFAPGSDRISPAQRENLDSLALALKQRTQLKLVVKGPYDAKRDGERLRRDAARRDLAVKMGTKMQAGEDPGPLAYGSADAQRALEQFLGDRAGSNALREFANQYAKRTGKQPDQVNPVLGLVGRGSRDLAFYEALFERLVELQPLPDTAPQMLAEKRAQAIVDTLVKAGLSPSRVQSSGMTQVSASSGSVVSAELALEAMPGTS